MTATAVCACGSSKSSEYAARVDSLRFALQTMQSTDRARDASDAVRRAEVIYEFLIRGLPPQPDPAGGSRGAIDGVTSK